MSYTSPDAGLGVMLSLACLGLFGAPATVGAQQASVMVEENVCEGELCLKVEGLRGSVPIGIYRDDALTSGIAFFVDAGEELTIVATNLHHDPPGLVVMVAPHEVMNLMDGSRLRLEVGDTVRILGYRGEGYFGFLWRGGAYEAEAFWPIPLLRPFRTDTPGRLIHPAHTHTWHQVRTADGRFGWVLSDRVVLEYFGDF